MPRVISDKRYPHSILVTSPNGVLHHHPDQLGEKDPHATFEVPTTNDDDDWPIPPVQEALEPFAVPPNNPLSKQPRRSLRIRHVPDRLTR